MTVIPDMNIDMIWDALEEVADPEIGVDVVNLGLIYDIGISDEAVALTLTLTSAGCPLREVLEDDIRKVLASTGKDIQFHWTFVPAWSPALMTDEGKDQLRSLGGYIPTY